ncbi:tRNA-2-methylthio-N6-dimethylallyladenosine synthase [Balneicella halophila]|uniref:tRNA-2-methylthio-N(6)-dimethylallyladenosine synthase n=1 Tax=Balneicella halophila TaxID=1537566 RepID=A0A7L4UPM7_BALHA|nr:tRNA (N6-isopentenyl adenosine(37)-C2)-methylthiotransferase MiaB [Balneicella halophila]PVX51085.1 tRNA-2-methylthio-N6-dimethylallyladenosine synthase [Balneicella halophila]
MKYHILTLGCQMNLSDGERVRTVLDKAGMQWVDDEKDAELLGIIACSVRQKAIDKVYNRIAEWNRQKDKRNLITFISGCILPDDYRKFLKLFDIIFQMKDLPNLPQMIQQYGVSSSYSQKESISPLDHDMKEFWSLTPSYQSDFEAFIPIQNGCDKFCTYCAVPYTRGREVSRPSSEILEEFKQLVDSGYKVITFLGQNVNSYGLDKKGKEINFGELIDKAASYADAQGRRIWIYFTSPHPRDMGRDVIEVIAKHPSMGKQIHLPLQSGDDDVLKKMNRKHNVEKYRNIVKDIKELIPEATIFTDIIVGFTGETDEQIENTRQAVEEFKYNMIYLAMYSPRPGAVSERWEDDIPKEVKSQRHQFITDELRKHTAAYNHSLVGKTFPVLVTKRDTRKPEYLSGYNEGKITVRFLSDDDSLIGKFVNVSITGASDFSVEGEMKSVSN